MNQDAVTCNWCEWSGFVEAGEDKCPECGEIGFLRWADEDNKED